MSIRSTFYGWLVELKVIHVTRVMGGDAGGGGARVWTLEQRWREGRGGAALRREKEGAAAVGERGREER